MCVAKNNVTEEVYLDPLGSLFYEKAADFDSQKTFYLAVITSIQLAKASHFAVSFDSCKISIFLITDTRFLRIKTL